MLHAQDWPELASRFYIYAPFGQDIAGYLCKAHVAAKALDREIVHSFDIRCGQDYLDRFRREAPGNAVLMWGRPAERLDLLRAAIEAPCHVAVKPPLLKNHAQMAILDELIEQAVLRELVLHDASNWRYDPALQLAAAIRKDGELLGPPQPPSPDLPTTTISHATTLADDADGLPCLASQGCDLVDLALWFLFSGWPSGPIVLHGARCGPQAEGTFSLADCTTRICVQTGAESETLVLSHLSSWATLEAGHGRDETGSIRPFVSLMPSQADDPADLLRSAERFCIERRYDFPGIAARLAEGRVEFVLPQDWTTDELHRRSSRLEEFVRLAMNPRHLAEDWSQRLRAKYEISSGLLRLACEPDARRVPAVG